MTPARPVDVRRHADHAGGCDAAWSRAATTSAVARPSRAPPASRPRRARIRAAAVVDRGGLACRPREMFPPDDDRGATAWLVVKTAAAGTGRSAVMSADRRTGGFLDAAGRRGPNHPAS